MEDLHRDKRTNASSARGGPARVRHFDVTASAASSPQRGDSAVIAFAFSLSQGR